MQTRPSALIAIGGLRRQIMPVLLLVLASAIVILRASPALESVPAQVTVPASPAIEDRWGIRVTQIGVTADGGMVDLRYQVTDPDKARAMLTEPTNWPVMVAEDSEVVIGVAAQMSHRHALNPGQTYFLLYLNAGGAIRPGTPVRVVIGNLYLDHVTAL